MTNVVDRILGLPGWLVLVIAGVLVFAEDALFLASSCPARRPPSSPVPPPRSAMRHSSAWSSSWSSQPSSVTASATRSATLLGFAAGASYAQVEKTFGRTAAFVVAGIVVVALVVWQVRKHLAERAVPPQR
jgi:hypothetical protein